MQASNLSENHTEIKIKNINQNLSTKIELHSLIEKPKLIVHTNSTSVKNMQPIIASESDDEWTSF